MTVQHQLVAVLRLLDPGMLVSVHDQRIPLSLWDRNGHDLGLVHIQQAHAPYTARLDWMRQFLRDHPGQKMIVDDRTLPMDTLMMTWASPYEFWLLSTLETGQTASVLLTDQPQEFIWAAGMPDQFIARWGVFAHQLLPASYFQFQEAKPYQVIEAGLSDQ